MTPDRLQQVQDLYHAARECAQTERAALLDQADPELRQEVESLLARDNQQGAIDRPMAVLAAEIMADSSLTQLAPGTNLGPYRIEGALGAGGMGEVYKARDTKLDRDVAIKVLPAVLAQDAARLARFEREARVLGSLNHPNIAQIYGLEESGGVRALVMELVPGKTLKGALPFDAALNYAKQIADALEAAHEKGIVHRDLKPANVMITPSGVVKVLDFGLAKATPEPLADHSLMSTEITSPTQAGTVLGTAPYMSPEQAQGKSVDKRTDIWAFGCVLYEMLTGDRAFYGETLLDTLTAVTTKEPDWDRVPLPAQRLLRKCLEKSRQRRLRDIGDAWLLLGGEPQAEPSSSVPRQSKVAWLIAAIAIGLALFALAWFSTRPSLADQSAYRFRPFAFSQGGQSGGVWSPDGKAVAYAASGPTSTQMMVRYLDSPLPARVIERANPIAWTPTQHILFFRVDARKYSIWSVAATGGEPEQVFSFDLPRKNIMDPAAWEPSGKAVAVLHAGEDGRYGVWISAPPGAALKKYSPDPFASRSYTGYTSLKFSPDGKRILLFIDTDRGPEAWLMPYPPVSSVPPHLVLTDLSALGTIPSQFDWMPDGRRIVATLPTFIGGSIQLWMADTISGEHHALTSGTTDRLFPAVSPDGRTIVFTERMTDYDIVSVNLSDASARPLIATGRNEQAPAWAAKQSALAYITDRNGPQEIWIRAGGADRPLVTASDFPPGTTKSFWPPDLSPEADRVIYGRTDFQETTRLWISAVSGGAPIPLTNDAGAYENPGSWSPDGNWFTYRSYKDGRTNLVKAKTTGNAMPVMLKSDIGVLPIPSWSPRGDWIAWGNELVSPDGKISRSLGKSGSPYYMFSADGKLVYGMRADGDRVLLYSVNVATRTERIVGDVGKEFAPASASLPGIRFSLAPDGKSFVYAVVKDRRNLWLLQGFEPKSGLLVRLGLR